ncbi:DUF4252 domain-containing protein [Candidatus Poribacteria bacterium]|nr:DUF4252 domain-containing protein [Candidatus Poribacteria bacterium]
MKILWLLKCIVLALSIALGFTTLAPSAGEKGGEIEELIEIDYPKAGEAKVEINLEGALFSLVAKAMKKENPDLSEVLSSLKAIKVRIYDRTSLGGGDLNEVLKFYEEQLSRTRWQVLTRVREEKSKIVVYSLTKEDTITGLVVLVGNPEEVVIVNLAGKIDLTRLSELDRITGVDINLPDLNIEEKTLPKRKDKGGNRRKAIRNLFDGDLESALAHLQKLEREGINNAADYALMALLYYSLGDLGESYRCLGKLYEVENLKDISSVFYRKAEELKP